MLDLGDGLAVAFKVESHNHPSAVEPFQGAATGVGGILRDIVAMGARPVALLDGLVSPSPTAFSRAVGGIGHYGNCVGVPTVGGEAVFDEAYRDNCLVNAMCVGLLPVERLMRAKATGRATTSSSTARLRGVTESAARPFSRARSSTTARRKASFGADRRPVHGKKLIEASIELVASGSSSRCRTAAPRASPRRCPRWRPTSGSTSTSIACRCERRTWSLGGDDLREPGADDRDRRPQMLEAVDAVLDRWELEHAVVGEVTESGKLRAFWAERSSVRSPRGS